LNESPAYSTAYPVAPLAEIFDKMYSTMSLDKTPGPNFPFTFIRICFGFVCNTHCVAKTISTSLVPMPKAIEPNAPCVLV
jgi:hypothetical protein